MNENLPEWYKVLNWYFEDDGYENGLTIPYLIGVSTIRTPKEPILTIDQLFKQAQDPNLPHKIELRFCEFEIAFVLRIYNALDDYPLEENYKVYDNLIITEESLSYLNLEEVIHEMYNLYQDPIQKGLYNRDLDAWSSYNQSDIQRIKFLSWK